MKKTRGFSYLEVLIAGALFAIALLAVIPVMSNAARNMIYAQEAYAGHLQAQRLMLVIREELLTENPTPQSRAVSYARGEFNFSVRILGRYANAFHSTPPPHDIEINITGLNPTIRNHASTIVVAVWCDEGQIKGRAVGMIFID